mmetsp:Transcript_18010/g.30282  ORF Transcript_18010/g.30282 Transcript_18010/m.30282 type:complete len:279 (-) Transcript_18010:563-1399(-)|eukprot:CAMPEP_0198204284 /NCGR_PEP_ID=MMETSP1445-20131203/7690_1 /TAXON_ID=36898 /ORGANISM="Pyramimonas sp., Strain CCMP2087" /LENGTH=278 /DNA_ID=CAMNT_0043876089 /DNA_START=215 /DNA_END=1051 /DNA_ORIENTATION=-
MGCVSSKVPGVPLLPKKPCMSNMLQNKMRTTAAKNTQCGDGSKDCTQEQIVAKEKAGWFPKGKEAWASFQRARPYSLEGYVPLAPKPGQPAPDGTVMNFNEADGKTTLLAKVRSLATTANGANNKVAIIFSCSTCPAFRVFGGHDFYQAFTKKGLPVLFVYTREAHGHDDFESAMNESGPFALKNTIDMHRSVEERRASAVLCHAHLATQLKIADVNIVIDDMDDKLERVYEARPFRGYVIDADSGTIVYASSLAPFNMPAKAKDISNLNLGRKANKH